ncbi:MAG: hypothetical protein ACK4S4_15705 [Pyrinomonadaceae bacterium]
MRDYVDIGPSPTAEDCAQVGSDDYYERARRECRVFIDQLRRQFGDEPCSASLSVRSYPHDFGTYYEVVCYFDDDDDEAVEYAYKLESETPEHWDADARVALGLFH